MATEEEEEDRIERMIARGEGIVNRKRMEELEGV